MDLSKLIWFIVIIALLGGGWLLTTGGMEKMYKDATKNLPGNDPAQDIKDEAILSKYGGFQQTLFRYQNAKIFYSAAIDRYGEEGANYWSNLHQLGKCEEKLDNEIVALKIYYTLWEADASTLDNRVPNRNVLKRRIDQLVALNDLYAEDYPMKE